VANGNLLLHQSDLTLQGTGLSLPLDQTYNSRVLYAGFHLGSWAFGTGDEILLSQYPRGDREFYGPSATASPSSGPAMATTNHLAALTPP
jgi:hypothetical protein